MYVQISPILIPQIREIPKLRRVKTCNKSTHAMKCVFGVLFSMNNCWLLLENQNSKWYMELWNLKVGLKGCQGLSCLCSLWFTHWANLSLVSSKTSLIPRKKQCCDHLCPTVYIMGMTILICHRRPSQLFRWLKPCQTS